MLARVLGVAAPTVNQWVKGHRPVPIEHCVAIEQATDKAVRRWDLRPLDWGRIWPELVGDPEAPKWPPETTEHAAPQDA